MRMEFEPRPERARPAGRLSAGPPRESSGRLELGPELGRVMPPLGVCFGEARGLADEAPLAVLEPAHLRLDLDLRDEDWEACLQSALADCAALGAELELALFPFGDPRGPLAAIESAVAASPAALARVIVLPAGEEATPGGDGSAWCGKTSPPGHRSAAARTCTSTNSTARCPTCARSPSSPGRSIPRCTPSPTRTWSRTSTARGAGAQRPHLRRRPRSLRRPGDAEAALQRGRQGGSRRGRERRLAPAHSISRRRGRSAPSSSWPRPARPRAPTTRRSARAA